MKINLNSDEYSEKVFLNKENIYSFIDEYSIFRYYIGPFQVGNIMTHPFRKDTKPSFGVFFSQMHNCLLFNDMARDHSGDCFTLVSTYIHPTFTYMEAMGQVVIDFGLQDRFVMPRVGFHKTNKETGKVYKNPPKYKMKYDIGIKARKYNIKDYMYWNSYGITLPTLKKYGVVPVSHFTYGNKVYKADPLAFAYIERKDDNTTYKIYQPYNKELKFFSSMDATVHAGYNQLPEKGNILIITKSMKDVMSIVENTDYHAISVLSEKVMIKDSVMNEYKERFNDIVVFFDNDTTGKEMSYKYTKDYDIGQVEVPKTFKECKDFSDIVKNYSIEEAVNFLEKEIFTALLFVQNDGLPF